MGMSQTQSSQASRGPEPTDAACPHLLTTGGKNALGTTVKMSHWKENPLSFPESRLLVSKNMALVDFSRRKT